MSDWVTVYEQAQVVVDEQADTEETRIWSVRTSYHKALNALHASSEVGDEDWVKAKKMLLEIADNLKALISKAEKTGQPSSRDSFVQEYAQISFLVSKNLSRVMSKEDLYEEALATGLEACETMFELEQFDAGLIFRVASMALQNDCSWSSRQLLQFNRKRISDLYGHAVVNLENAIERRESVVKEIVAIKEISENSASSHSSVLRIEGEALGAERAVKLLNDLLSVVVTADVEQIGSLCLDQVVACLDAPLGKDVAVAEEKTKGEEMEVDAKDESSANKGGEQTDKLVPTEAAAAADSLAPTDTSTNAMAKDRANEQKSQSSNTSEPPKQSESSESSRRSSRKRRVSTMLASGNDSLTQVSAGKAASSSKSGPEKESESEEFFESAKSILSALVSAGLPLKKAHSAEQLIEEFQSIEVSSGDEVAQRSEAPAPNDGAIRDSLAEATNSIIAAIVSSSLAKNTNSLMVGFIRSLSQTIEDNLHRSSSPAMEAGVDFDKLALGVTKCWSYIVITHNSSVEDSLQLFSASESLFIVECCSDFVRHADHQESKIQDSLLGCYEVAKNTLDVSLLHWSTQNSLTHDSPAVLTLRRSWVFLTYWLTGRKGEQCAHIAEMDTKNLLHVIRDISSQESHVQLPHLHGWNVINEDKISFLEAILQDNVKLKTLVESHTDTSVWLESALGVLRKDGDVASTFRMGAKRKVDLTSCLPLLALRTFKSLGESADHNLWWDHFGRIVAEGLDSVLSLVKEGAEDAFEIERWFESSLEFIAELIPPVQEGSINAAALRTSCSVSLLMLIAQGMENLNIFSSLCKFSATYLQRSKSEEVSGVFAKTAVALMMKASKPTVNSGAKLQRSCESLTLSFALHLVALGVFTLSNANQEESLGYVSFILDHHGGGDKKAVSMLRRYTDASILTAVFLGWPGQDVTVDQKVDLLGDYHSISCDFDLYALDKGQSLLHFASLLQSSVEVNYFRTKNAANATGHSVLVFDFQKSGTARQSDVSTCLGEMYWLLYAFPLVTFSYTDDSSKQCTHFRLPIDDPNIIEKLYIFYLDAVSLGLGNRGDRRSSLNLLTQTRTLLDLPHMVSSYAEIFKGVFVESMPLSTATLRKAVEGPPKIDEESRRIMALMPEALESIYYERLVYAGDLGTTGYEVLDIDYICKDFPVPEQRVLFAIDMCVRDLTFNPRRYTTWLLLHVKLAEYLELVCDELGELCIPELLAPQMHLLMRPSAHTTMKNLLDGDLRFASEAINAIEKVFHKRTALDAKTIVRKAWSGKQVAVEYLYPMVAMKNMLREGMSSVYAIMNTDSNFLLMQMPTGQAMTEEYKSNSRFQPHVTHGRMMQLLSMDYEECHSSYRDFQSIALRSYQHGIDAAKQDDDKKHLSRRTILFILCQAVKIDWDLYRDSDRTLKLMVGAAQRIPVYNSKDPSRYNSLNDLIPVAIDMALQFLDNDSGEEQATTLWNIILLLSGANIETDNNNERTLNVVGKFKAVIPATSSVARDNLWAVIAISLFMMRDLRCFAKHDTHSIFTLASTSKRLSERICPDWFKGALQERVVVISSKGALEEIHKLFYKRVPQIIALWSVEKAENEWDSQLQRIYVYEFLRRKYARLLSELCIICANSGSISHLFDLAKDASNRLKTRKAATVRWLLDLAVRTASRIACTEPAANRTHLSSLFELIQYLEAKQGQISENGYRKLRSSIVALYTLEVPDAESCVTLAGALRYCFDKYGKAAGPSLFAEGGKRGALPKAVAGATKVAKIDSRATPSPSDENTEIAPNVSMT